MSISAAGTTTSKEPYARTPTLDKLHALKLPALAQAWTEQQLNAELAALSFDERVGLLVGPRSTITSTSPRWPTPSAIGSSTTPTESC